MATKPVSIGAAWTEARDFIRREAGLVFPVALLFIAIPIALIFEAIPTELRQAPVPGVGHPQIPGTSLLLIAACSVVMVGGTLACYALAVKPGISLGEALAHGFRRLPVAIGSALVVGVALGLPMVLLSAASPQLGALVMLVAALLLSAKLLLINVVIVDRPCGPVDALRASWALSRGNLGRLLMFVIGISIPVMLAQTVAEVLLGLAGLALGGPEVGRQMGLIGAAGALGVGQLVMIVMTSRIYRQITA